MAELPDLTGKSVLDIGAFGAGFSFEAERRGAAEVTALEYYFWVLDFLKMRKWVAETLAAGRFLANSGFTEGDMSDSNDVAQFIAHLVEGTAAKECRHFP